MSTVAESALLAWLHTHSSLILYHFSITSCVSLLCINIIYVSQLKLWDFSTSTNFIANNNATLLCRMVCAVLVEAKGVPVIFGVKSYFGTLSLSLKFMRNNDHVYIWLWEQVNHVGRIIMYYIYVISNKKFSLSLFSVSLLRNSWIWHAFIASREANILRMVVDVDTII